MDPKRDGKGQEPEPKETQEAGIAPRIKAAVSIAALAASVIVGGPASATPGTGAGSIAQRVAAVRVALNRRLEGDEQLSGTDLRHLPFPLVELAQWLNWNNWGNWNNWRDWNNWHDWANAWTNWVNI